MEISGQRWLPAPPEVVWETLHDVDMLRMTIPGCKELTQIAPNCFEGSASVGIGVIKGLYKGGLELTLERPYSEACVAVNARSGHAEIRGNGDISLEPSGEGTLVRYRGEARISGPIAAVGQRLLPSATKSLTESFLKNVEEALRKQRVDKGA
jgi:carbon monoxide dehydrogenase subunit G